MKPKKIYNEQYHIFTSRLSTQLNPDHALIQLSKLIDWRSLDDEFSTLFVEESGQEAKPVRLVVGLMMLQHMYGMSDEEVVRRWPDNPYWQFLCGYDFLQHQRPVHPTSLVRWRHRLGAQGLKRILEETITVAVNAGMVKKKALRKPLLTLQ